MSGLFSFEQFQGDIALGFGCCWGCSVISVAHAIGGWSIMKGSTNLNIVLNETDRLQETGICNLFEMNTENK